MMPPPPPSPSTASPQASDVIQQHEMVERLREAHQRATLAMGSVGMGTWVHDQASGRDDWDAQMFRLRGMAPAATTPDAAGRAALVHPDDRERIAAMLHEGEVSTEVLSYEFRVVWPDGSMHWLASRSTPLLDEQGRMTRRIGVNWDVTEAKSIERAQRERELALRENDAKTRLLARVSHELRTPLNAVLGFTQLLQDERGPDDIAARGERLDRIETAARHLLALIDDVLELSSVQSSALPIALQPLALAPLVQATLVELATEARAYGVSIECGALEAVVLADPARLRQVLVNLVCNSIKFNRRGGTVWIDAEPRAGAVLLRVRDNGIGVAAEHQQEMFEPLTRLRTERADIEGHGLGLAIVKASVERMGGRITVQSQPLAGTTIEVWLDAAQSPDPAPAVAVPPATPSARTSAPMRPVRVLYIEDNPVNMMIVRELIALRPGFSFEGSEDGASGVAQAQRTRPDLVLVDMQLPDFDGLEVLRRLRADPLTAALRCVALSANAVPEDMRRAKAAGFADYWTKPIDFGAFNAALDAILAAPRG